MALHYCARSEAEPMKKPTSSKKKVWTTLGALLAQHNFDWEIWTLKELLLENRKLRKQLHEAHRQIVLFADIIKTKRR